MSHFEFIGIIYLRKCISGDAIPQIHQLYRISENKKINNYYYKEVGFVGEEKESHHDFCKKKKIHK